MTWCSAASDPVGEQGSDIARTAVLNADYAESVAGVQINRFCASGLEASNMAAAQIMSGRVRHRHRRRRRKHEPRAAWARDGGAWPTDPSIAIQDLFRAARHRRRSHRHEGRLQPRRRRRLRGGKPEARRQCLGEGLFQEIGHAGEGSARPDACSITTSTCAPTPPCSRWPR